MKQLFTSLALISLFIVSCKKSKKEESISENASTTPTTSIPLFKQFADSVLAFSSEYTASPGNWSAFQALGAPNVYPQSGDIIQAWASANSSGQREYLSLSFDTIQTVSKIEVYETYNPGAIDTIYLRNSNSQQWSQIWTATAQASSSPARILTVDIPETSFKIDAIRIAINSPSITGYNEIDAVRITGKR